MHSMIIQRVEGRWFFNGKPYKDLYGKEKEFVDKMRQHVDIEILSIVRTPNDNLKRHNYQFAERQ